MTELDKIWRKKPDALLRAAVERINDYGPDARSVILAEFNRRQMGLGATEQEVVVAEEHSLERMLAPRHRRLIARIIDGAISSTPFILISFFADDADPSISSFAAGFLLLHQLFSGWRNGQSLGKKLLGIVVVDQRTMQPCALWQTCRRNVTLLVASPVDELFIVSGKRQRLGDFIANTLVTNIEEPRTP